MTPSPIEDPIITDPTSEYYYKSYPGAPDEPRNVVSLFTHERNSLAQLLLQDPDKIKPRKPISEYRTNRATDRQGRRHRTITRVDECIRTRFGQEYRIFPFGSTCYGAAYEDGDLDLVILVRSFSLVRQAPSAH